MVIIRLSRGGSKKKPFYNIIVTNSLNSRDGRFIEKIGFYNPMINKEKNIYISIDRLNYWKSVGAQLSLSVKRIVKKNK